MPAIKGLTLYAYFYSSASWRIRAAMALKNISYKYQAVHLLDGQQNADEYLKINPMHQVPSMEVEFDDGSRHILTQSLAIISFLEHHYPEKPVYPTDPIERAKAMAIADSISAGIQPLQNLETLVHYTEPLGLDPLNPEARKRVAQFWLKRKLENLERLVSRSAGVFCVGDKVTIADLCLVPQMFNARRFEVDVSSFPVLVGIDERLQKLDAFKQSHVYNAPDTPDDLRKKFQP